MDQRQQRNFEQMKAWRGPRVRDLSVGATITSIAKFATKRQRDLGEVLTTWNALCPAKLASSCTVDSLTGGILSITVTTAGAGFELSRVLRASLERELTTRFPTRIRRIKVSIGEDAATSHPARNPRSPRGENSAEPRNTINTAVDEVLEFD